jgi:hypothetical protein
MARRRRQAAPEDQHRAKMIRRVAEILNNPDEPSRFTYEGACRHGLRSAFCLEGVKWELADAMAAIIVSAALRSIGAIRPTWEMGQPEWTQDGATLIEWTTCALCGCPLPERDPTIGGPRRRYCSDGCRYMAAARKASAVGYRATMAEVAAHKAAMREHYRLQKVAFCEHCGTMFTQGHESHKRRRRYCSTKCWHAAAGEVMHRLPKRRCPGCRSLFRPRSATTVYCSKECRLMAEAVPPIACAHCATVFKPRHRGVKYCNETCFVAARAAAVHDRECPVCLSRFTPRGRTDPKRFCSPRCSARYREGHRRKPTEPTTGEESSDPPPIMLAAE